MPEDRLTVGVLSPLLAGGYFGVVLKGIASYTASAGGRVVAIQTRDAQLGGVYPWTPPPFNTPLAWDQADGFVSVIDGVTDSYLARLKAYGKPVVLISRDSPGLLCPEVLPDNRSGTAEAVRHLIAHGHTRIAFAGQMDRMPGDDVYERYEAYCDTLRDHGLVPAPDLLFAAPNSLEQGGDTVGRALLRAGLPCTAVVAATDLIAAGIIRALKPAGVALPSQMAVVGFDDRYFAAGLSPALASVRADFAAVGELAARLLVGMVQGVPVAPRRYRVPTTFLPRESCGCRALPLPGPRDHGSGGAEEHLVAELTGLLAGVGGTEAERQVVAGIAEGISRCCQDALRAASPDVDALRRVAEEAYEAFPRTATTSAVIQCTLDYRLGLLEREGYSAARLATLDACVLEIVHALNAADTRKHVRLNAGLQASLAEEHFVSLALVGMGEREAAPRSLAWLEGTHAKTACLGLWTGDHMDEEWVSKPLRLAGLFGPGPSTGWSRGRRSTRRSSPRLPS